MTMDSKKLGAALLSLFSVTAFAQDPVAEYENLLRETQGLVEYNALLERQIEQQRNDVASLQAAIEQVPELERQIPPLLITMVDGLDEFVRLDIPFLVEERADRVANLRNLIEDADTNDTTKLRRILEAWSIEVEYGGNYRTESGSVNIDGAERAVDFFVLGRTALLFQTSDDEALVGAWDPRTNSWDMSLGSEHRNSVRQVIRMARSQIAPDLVLLPVIPPQTD